MKSLPSHRYHFFPVQSMSDHYDYANSPPDCSAPSSFDGMFNSNNASQGNHHSHFTTVIRHLLPGQIARPQITRHRPPKLRNRFWVIRQVSHCGKPQRTASPKKPFGFSAFAKLASGTSPPWIPQQGLFNLCTPKHDYLTLDIENHPPDNFLHPSSVRLRVPPLHPAKGITSPWNLALHNTLCISGYTITFT